MEQKTEYVLYEQVKTNEYVQQISRLSNAVKILKRTKDGVVIKEIISYAPYKYAKTINELSSALNEDEYLIIDLNDLKKESEELHAKVRETIDSTKIIEYVSHEQRLEDNKFKPNEKIYAVPYYYFKRNKIPSKDFTTIKVYMTDENLYDWGVIWHLSSTYTELDEILYGGYSGVYLKVPEDKINEFEEVIELTKISDGKWTCQQYEKNKSK